MVSPKTMAYISIIAVNETRRVYREDKELPEGGKTAKIRCTIMECLPDTVAADMGAREWFLLGTVVGETAREIRGKCAFDE